MTIDYSSVVVDEITGTFVRFRIRHGEDLTAFFVSYETTDINNLIMLLKQNVKRAHEKEQRRRKREEQEEARKNAYRTYFATTTTNDTNTTINWIADDNYYATGTR